TAAGCVPRDDVDVRTETFEFVVPDPRVLERAVKKHERGSAPTPLEPDAQAVDHDDLRHGATVRLWTPARRWVPTGDFGRGSSVSGLSFPRAVTGRTMAVWMPRWGRSGPRKQMSWRVCADE